VGTNFVDAIGIESDSGFLKMPWFRLLGINQPVAYVSTTGALRLRSMEQFVSDHKKSLFKSWFTKLIDTSAKVRGSWHPPASGHEIWAKYILESIS
jgi:hypothetical protein